MVHEEIDIGGLLAKTFAFYSLMPALFILSFIFRFSEGTCLTYLWALTWLKVANMICSLDQAYIIRNMSKDA